MKNKKIFVLVLITAVTVLLTGCSQGNADTLSDKDTTSEETTGSDSGKQTVVEETDKMLQLKISDTIVEVAWEENESVEALRKLCGREPLTIQMSMYGGFEQVGSIGAELPANDSQTTTDPGDIVLYSGNQIVVFYGSNSWAYTRLGHITGKSAEELTELLGSGDVTVSLMTEYSE